MIRMIFVFVLLTVLIAGSISSFRTISGKERWELVKLLAFSLACSIISFIILVGIVVVF